MELSHSRIEEGTKCVHIYYSTKHPFDCVNQFYKNRYSFRGSFSLSEQRPTGLVVHTSTAPSGTTPVFRPLEVPCWSTSRARMSVLGGGWEEAGGRYMVITGEEARQK